MAKHQRHRKTMNTGEEEQHSPPDKVQVETSEITQKMLKTFFKGDEIYEYADSISQDYKEFKKDVVSFLQFIQKRCDEGKESKDIKTMNGIQNFITSFLLRNHLIDYKDDEI